MNTTKYHTLDTYFNGEERKKYAELYREMAMKRSRDTEKYTRIALEFDVTADFREVNRILTENKRSLQFIKSSPIFFANEDDEIIECDEFGKDLKLWLMSCNQEYYVFLNCGIRRYDNYLNDLKALSSVNYDISYPIFEVFDNEKDALAFYEKIELLLDTVKMQESVKKKFKVEDISQIMPNDYHYGRRVDFFEKTIYCFNHSQNLSIFLQKMDSEFSSMYYIFVNRKIKLFFDNKENRDECWKYLTNFYNKFKKKTIQGVSTQLFLTDFFIELKKKTKKVREFEKEEGKVVWLRCEFKGYDIFFRLISRNGRYWGDDFELNIGKYEKGERVFNENMGKIRYLKSMMQKLFLEEEFMKKYFSC